MQFLQNRSLLTPTGLSSYGSVTVQVLHTVAFGEELLVKY